VVPVVLARMLLNVLAVEIISNPSIVVYVRVQTEQRPQNRDILCTSMVSS